MVFFMMVFLGSYKINSITSSYTEYESYDDS